MATGRRRWRRCMWSRRVAATATASNGSTSTPATPKGSPGNYNRIAQVEPAQVEEWQVGAPPSVYDGPYWRAEWWGGCRSPSVAGRFGTPTRATGLTTSPSARS